MAGSERDELNAAGKEQWIGAEHECAGALLRKGGEDCLYLAAITGVEHFDPLSNRRCRCPHLGGDGFGQWIVWIEQQPDEIGARQQLTDQAEPFFRQPAAEEIHAGRVAAGPVEARHKPRLDRIVFAAEDDGYRRGGCLRRDRCNGACWYRDHVHPASNQLGRQRRQSTQLILSPAVFDGYILPLDTARRAEALAEGCNDVRALSG